MHWQCGNLRSKILFGDARALRPAFAIIGYVRP